MNGTLSRRGFVKQSFAFSALAGLGSLPSLAKPHEKSAEGFHWFMVGDWGYERPAGQEAVAATMSAYVRERTLKPDVLLMLGDNWYGDLTGGVDSPRWKTHFEDL